MSKTKTDEVEQDAVEVVAEAQAEEPTTTPSQPKNTKGAATFTREELARSKDFKDSKWLLYAVIQGGEKVTKAEAHKRIDAFKKKTI